MKYEIHLHIHDNYDSKNFEWRNLQMKRVEGDSLVEVLSKFLIIMAQLQEEEVARIRKEMNPHVDDDIPF